MALWDGVWWNDNFNQNEKNIAEQLEHAIVDKDIFVLLYIISPDLLVYGICCKLRENGIKLKDVPDEMYEDVVGPMVHKVFRECFMTVKGRKAFLKMIDSELAHALSRNPNQRTIGE
jgi:hypothetical protein